MYWQLPPAVFIILFINIIFAHGSTTIVAYSDQYCQTEIKTYTETDYSQCYPLPSAESVSVIVQDTYCPVSIHSDPDCNWGAKLANLNTCTSPYIVKSYTIDCHYPTSTSKAPNTVIAAPAPATSIPSPVVPPISLQPAAQSPSPTPSMPLAQSPSNNPDPQSSPTVVTIPAQVISLSAPSTLTSTLQTSTSTKSPSDDLTSTTTDPPLLVDTTSPAPVPAPPTQNPSETLSTGNATDTGTPSPNTSSNTGLSVPVQIFLGTLFPAMGIMATVIFGINQWRRKEERLRKRRQRRHDDLISMISRPQGGASISAFRPGARSI